MTFVYGLICGVWLGCVIFAGVCLAAIEAKRFLGKKGAFSEERRDYERGRIAEL